MENKCTCEACSSESSKAESCSSKSESCCPIEKTSQMLCCAFQEAMKKAHVEILKAKILKAWGPKIEKSADAMLETMAVQWQSMLDTSKAKMDLKERLAKIMMENKK